MEQFIEVHKNTLASFGAKGISIPDNAIDYLYQQGYMQNVEYQKFYMDSTRRYIPELQMIENNDLLTNLDRFCERVETIENKNRMIYQAKKQQQVNKGFFS